MVAGVGGKNASVDAAPRVLPRDAIS